MFYFEKLKCIFHLKERRKIYLLKQNTKIQALIK